MSAPTMSQDPLAPPPNPELEQLEPVSSRRRRGTPAVRILLWGLMSIFLTVPLVGLGVYTIISFKKWDQKLQKVPRRPSK